MDSLKIRITDMIWTFFSRVVLNIFTGFCFTPNLVRVLNPDKVDGLDL